MHHIYHTEGIILDSRNYGEASRYYFILTRDMGLVMASAQGVRKMSSKLRYILQNYSYVKLDFVRARGVWKITSASKIDYTDDLLLVGEKFKIVCNVSSLLKRLLPDEERNVELFDDYINGLSALRSAQTKLECSALEAIIVLRILYNLGYIGEQGGYGSLARLPIEADLIYEVGKKRKGILGEINKALRETQL